MNIRILSNVKHNGKRYEKGDEIKGLTDEYALALIEAGAAEDIDKKAASPERKKTKRQAKKKDDKTPSLDWTRAELEEHAEGLGMKDVQKFANKKELLEAIEADAEDDEDSDSD